MNCPRCGTPRDEHDGSVCPMRWWPVYNSDVERDWIELEGWVYKRPECPVCGKLPDEHTCHMVYREGFRTQPRREYIEHNVYGTIDGVSRSFRTWSNEYVSHYIPGEWVSGQGADTGL